MRRLNEFKVFFLLSMVIVAVLGCQNNNGSSIDNASDADHALIHYWDDFDFTNTVAVINSEIGKQKLIDFITAFPKVSDTIRVLAINKLLSQAKHVPASFEYFTEQFEHYLYDPNSPIRNDLYYESVLAFIVDSARLSNAEKLSYTNLLNLVRKNQVGTQASDFGFLLPDGNNGRLYDMDVPFTMLFFYEPGCSFCEESITQLEASSFFQQLIDKEVLHILAIYPYGNSDIWKGYQDQIPVNWTNGFDPRGRIIDKSDYDIRATPTIYLLDENKKVVLKDTNLAQLASFFTKHENHL